MSNAAWAREGVSFKTPANNVTIMSPLHLEFAVEGMDVLPAADGLIEGTGHFHLMIDEKTQFEEGRSIPFDETHLHYGKGQTAADITLTPVCTRMQRIINTPTLCTPPPGDAHTHTAVCQRAAPVLWQQVRSHHHCQGPVV